jgi:acyl transferase domain-containing protein/acyl carrier protein
VTGWPEPVAIVGMAGRFPGALDVGQFWTGLIGGVQSIRFLPDPEPASPIDPRLVRASATAPELDGFDAEFFGLSTEQAAGTDPRGLVLLECAHAALEDAGYNIENTTEVGLFAAAGGSVGHSTGTEPTSLVSRLLGLRGPSLGIQAGEAGSLVAVHLACAAVLAGECELALAGGVQFEPALSHGYRWEPGDGLSRDGYCRPFDRAATGTVPAAGAGMVVLKRLSDALADRDRIWAVLRSTATSFSGSIIAGVEPAAVAGQSAAIERALHLAGAGPSELTMLEAHAAGNPARDRIELAALRAVYRGPAGACALGSVKGNVGHLGPAAGVTSLIKVALSLAKQAIPVTAGFRQPHPALELDGSAFYLPTRAVGWPRSADRPRLAGVNASDAGGTNVHAIVAEAPAAEPEPAEQRPRLIVWSARTPTAAERYRGRLAEHFGAAGRTDFARSVATLQGGRTGYARRGAVVAADPAEAVARLSDPDPAGRITAPWAGPSRIAFLFPGQGAQQAGLAQDLYDQIPSYAKAFDECLELFEATGLPLRRWWRQADDAQLHSPQVALPLTFAIEHALVQTWQSWGITPAVVAGLSIGELSAATVAGVCSLDEIVPAIAVRAQGLQALPPSGVMGVAGTRAEVEPLLPDGAWVAVVTGPRQLVVAGWPGPLADATAALEQAGLTCRPAPATRAVHGPIAASAVPAFEQAMRGLSLAAPVIELYSANTGRLTSPAEATDSRFWARQLVQPVRFAETVDALTAGPGRLLLIEVGPGQMLTSALRRHPAVTSGRHRLLPTLAHRPVEPQAQLRSALTALGTVWAEGHSVDWAAVSDLEVGRTSVPGYPFERSRLVAGQPVVTAEPVRAVEQVQFAEQIRFVEPVQFVEPVRPAEPVQFAEPAVEFVPPKPVGEFVPPKPAAEGAPVAPVAVQAPPAPAAPMPAAPAAEIPAAPAARLPAAPAAPAPATHPNGRSPGTAARLRQLWLGVLGEHEIGPETDFFDLGGNSLTAVELMAAVRSEFDVELRTIVLFEHPTLDALAAQIDRRVA